MINGLHDIILNPTLDSCVVRDGFVFTHLDIGNVYDALVVRYPKDCDISSYRTRSSRSLKEHIELINKHKLEKAYIIANNIDFITQCPTLKHLIVIPIVNDDEYFDYSPLYELENLESLCCNTSSNWRTVATVDYSKCKSRMIHTVDINGEGHLNIEYLKSLTNLFLFEDKSFNDLNRIKYLAKLTRLNVTASSLVSLSGIEGMNKIEEVILSYNKKLKDISQLKNVSKSLKSLYIENSPKITDFSCLEELVNLEDLSLYGRNVLPNLNFLNNMKNLKYFIFSMQVEDCDLSPCLQIPYVDCEKGKKEYNYKNKDLPKIRTK